MAASAGSNQNQAIHSHAERLPGMTNSRNIMKYQSAIAMGGFHDHRVGLQTGDDNGHLVLHAHLHVVFQPVIG